MELAEQKVLYETLQRVQRSLNERFEKDASLYIPVEDIEEIKQNLYENHYANIAGLYTAKKYSAEILTNVVVKNAWLMQKKNYQELLPVIKACDFSYLKQLMDNYIFDNKLDMEPGFRSKLIVIYFERADKSECQQLLDENALILGNPSVRAICLRKCLADSPSLERYKKLNTYFRKWPALLNGDSRKILKDAFSEDDFTDQLCEKIFLEQFSDKDSENPVMTFWRNGLPTSKIEIMLKQMTEYFRNNSQDFAGCRTILNRLAYYAKENVELFTNYLIQGCAYVPPRTRNMLVSKALEKMYQKQQKDFLINALEEADIEIPDQRDIPDLGRIGKMLEERYITAGKMKFLTAIFHQQYHRQAKNKLSDLSFHCSESGCLDNFEEFCLVLMETCGRSNPWYVVYNIEEMTDSGNRMTIRRILQYIEAQDLLRKPGAAKDYMGIIAGFVRNQDFALFRRLTA